MFESISKLIAIRLATDDQELVFFTVAVALSAYLASVRFFVVMRADTKGDKKSMRRKLRYLLPGDALITTAAALVGLHALFAIVPHWFLSLGVWLFTAGGLVLLGLHFFAWILTLFPHQATSTENTAPPPQEVRKVESDISCNGQPLHVTLSLVVPAETAAKRAATPPQP